MILISGEALIDLIPDPERVGSYDAVLGGSPYNVAIGLGRLGAPAAFVSRLSRDPNGEALAAALEKDGVSLQFVERTAEPTTLAFVMRGTAQTGSRYSFYLDSTAYDGPWPLPAEWPAEATHLHVGSFSAVERHAERVIAALEAARGKISVGFDPNIRPLVTPDRAAVVPLVEREAKLATFVKASEEDLEWIYPGRPVLESLSAIAQMGPKFAIATLGEKGALACLGADQLVIPPRKIKVVDTVGAGDSFMSGLIYAMSRDGGLKPSAAAPPREKLGQWLAFAAKTSAITCTRKGSDPPTLAEVLATPD